LNKKYPTDEIKKAIKEIRIEGRRALKEKPFFYNPQFTIRSNSFFTDRYKDSEKNLKGSLSLKGFINLKTLKINSNELTSTDLSDCPELRELTCYENELTYLDLSNNTQISQISCSNNKLTKLILPESPYAISNLSCQKNHLTGIDLGKRYNLYSISCADNQLTSLDLSNCINLEIIFDNEDYTKTERIETDYSSLNVIYCENNQLTSLKLPNCLRMR